MRRVVFTPPGITAWDGSPDEVLAEAVRLATEGQPVSIGQINVHNLRLATNADAMANALSALSLVTVDGRGVGLLARRNHVRLIASTGMEIMWAALRWQEQARGRVLLFGAKPPVNDRAVADLRSRGINARGLHGYGGPRQWSAAAEMAREMRPDLVLVGLPSPDKEIFMADHSPAGTVTLGVGGGIDILAGATREAPVMLRRAGLEWLYRLAQEPRRLAGRYAAQHLWLARQLWHPRVEVRGE